MSSFGSVPRRRGSLVEENSTAPILNSTKADVSLTIALTQTPTLGRKLKMILVVSKRGGAV